MEDILIADAQSEILECTAYYNGLEKVSTFCRPYKVDNHTSGAFLVGVGMGLLIFFLYHLLSDYE